MPYSCIHVATVGLKGLSWKIFGVLTNFVILVSDDFKNQGTKQNESFEGN